jgi:hypothetical protein
MYIIRDKISPTPETRMPTVIGAAPTEWWGENEDRDLLIGTLKYGYQQYSAIAADPEFCFAARLGITADSSLGQSFVDDTEDVLKDENDDGEGGASSNDPSRLMAAGETSESAADLKMEEAASVDVLNDNGSETKMELMEDGTSIDVEMTDIPSADGSQMEVVSILCFVDS